MPPTPESTLDAFLPAYVEAWDAGLDQPVDAPEPPATIAAELAKLRGFYQESKEYIGAVDFHSVTDQPRRLGRFLVRRTLGSGGHGVVLLADDPETSRPVALKIPRPDCLLKPGIAERFEREARAIAELDHPHIVRVFGTAQAGPVRFVIEEFVDGSNLAEWLEAHPAPLSPSDAATFLLPVIDAVGHCHERGIVHRDLKPANVLLAGTGDDLLALPPKIVDFGLAWMADATALTRTGQALGTPLYMAPEQADGKRADLGPATDIHALGILLYELLTRWTPYEARTPLHVLRRILDDRPTELRALRHEVPKSLASICRKCLAKRPGDRYRRAADLKEDLLRFLAGRTPMARREVTRRRFLKTVAATTAVVGGGLGVAEWIRQRNIVANPPPADDTPERLAAYGKAVADAQTAYEKGDLDTSRRLVAEMRKLDAKGDIGEFAGAFLKDRIGRVRRPCPDKRGIDELIVRGEMALTWNGAGQGLCLRDLDNAAQERLITPTLSRPSIEAGGQGFQFIDRKGMWRRCDWNGRESVLGETALAGKEREWWTALHAATGRMVYRDGDGGIRLGHVREGGFALLCDMGPAHREIRTFDFSPDGEWLAIYNDRGPVRLFNARTRLPGPELKVQGVPTFSPDGKHLIVSGIDGQAHVFELADGRRLFHFQSLEKCPVHAALSLDGRLLAINVDEAKQTRPSLWDLKSGRKLASLDACPLPGGYHSPVFHPDGKRIFFGSGSHGLWEWRIDGLEKSLLSGSTQRYWFVAASPAVPNLIASGGEDEVCALHDVVKGDLVAEFTANPGAMIYHGAFSPDGKTLALGCYNRLLRVFDVREAEKPRFKWERIADSKNGVRCVAYSPDGKAIAIGTKDGTVSTWEPETSLLLKTLGKPEWEHSIGGLGFTPDGKQLVVQPSTNHLLIMNLDTWKLEPTDTPTEMFGLAIHPKEKRFVASTDLGVVMWFDITGRVHHEKEAGTAKVWCAAFSPDGRTLATGDEEGTITLWDGRTGERLTQIRGHTAAVRSLAFNHENPTRLVSADWDGTLRTWWTR